MSTPSYFRLAIAASASVFALAFTGCSALNMTATSPQQIAGLSIQGKVHGGSQPVSGARVYLLAANSSGYPTAATNASVSLLTSATGGTADSVGYYTTTDAGGYFSITGDYTCTSGQQVYLLAVGGDPGLGSVNTSLAEATVLGACPASGNFLASIPSLFVNEVTTVAAAYSLAGFSVDAYHIGAPSSAALASTHPAAAQGIANAFLTFPLLANAATGVANTNTGTTAGNGTVPQAEIDTLANILSACVNSTGTSGTCSTLFSNATSDGTSTGTRPTDTFTAAINIAHHPAANISNLCGLQSGTGAPYQPSLACSASSLPNDFTVVIQYPETSGATMNDVAVDASGNIFVVGSNGLTGRYSASTGYTEYSFAWGLLMSGGPNFTKVAIGADRIIVADNVKNQIFTVSQDLQQLFYSWSQSGYSFSPSGISLSADLSKVYVSDAGSEGGILRWAVPVDYSASSSCLGETTTNFAQPVRNAVDASGNVWGINRNSATVGEMSSTGTAIASRGLAYTNGGSGIAIDQNGLIWVTSSVGGAAGQISPSGSNISGTSSPTRYTSGDSGQHYPTDVAIDGANSAWMSNTYHSGIQSLSRFNSSALPLSPANGFETSTTDTASLQAVAIDASGNVWTIGSKLYELVGAATPVVTPIYANLASPYSSPASKP